MKVVGALASAILCLALASTGPVGAQTPPHDRHGMHTHDHSFKDAAKWSRMFDDPTRDEWQKPHQPNLTGTAYAYRPKGSILGVPTRPKSDGEYDAWQPK